MFWIQLIGWIAVSLSIATFLFNKRSSMLITDFLAAALYALHFFLLGAITGGAMNLIGAIRGVVYYHYPPTKIRRWLFMFFIIIACIATAIFWQGPLSLLALGGTLSYALAYWQSNPTYIRRYLMASYPLWFVYNAISGSYPGMAIEVILFSANVIGQYRFDRKRIISAVKATS